MDARGAQALKERIELEQRRREARKEVDVRTVEYQGTGAHITDVVKGTKPREHGLVALVTAQGHVIEPNEVLFDSECSQCVSNREHGGPRHVGSRGCQSHGLGAPGGYRAHCTCDACW